MNKTLLAASINLCLVGAVYAAENVEVQANAAPNTNEPQVLQVSAEVPPALDTSAAATETSTAATPETAAVAEEATVSESTPVAEEAPASTPVADATPQADATPVAEAAPASTPAAEPTPVAEPVVSTPSLAAQPTTSMAPSASSAASALQKQEGDVTQETNLQEVFTSNELQYSLIKKGEISTFYDLDYTYFRDSRLDLAINDGVVNQLRVEEDANHTFTNTVTLQYGLRDNVTLTTSVPLVAKTDKLRDTTAAGLGDVAFGARWEPFPLQAGRLPLILFGNLSTKTGDSPYEINPVRDLSTGKGYYSVGFGASTRKYIDPVVLFGSVSANYGFKESDLNQVRGSRIITEFDPGISGGFAFGFAYSFNYDVSLTMSYQQSFNFDSQFTYSTGETFRPADQTSSTFAIALGVRTSPQTIVNGTLGIGLTEDAPDVSLGLSFPLDILGLAKKDKKKQENELARGASQNASR